MLEPSGNIFVTGATGFLGSHFVREWTRSEYGHVFALVRSRGTHPGDCRLDAALELADWASGTPHQVSRPSLTAIDGDVTQSLAGISSKHARDLRGEGVESFWHFAADLRPEDRNREPVWRTNADGTRHALELAITLGAKRFVYVSTAFVSGRQGGLIEEKAVPISREFNNSYEASKAEAERLLTLKCEHLGLQLNILRPSIVIGPSTTKCAYGSETGLISLIQAIMLIRSSQSGQSLQLRIPALPEAELNFVPVDSVVSDMLALARSGFGSQCFHHLTSTSSISVAQCWRAISQVTGMCNVVLVPPNSFAPTPAEQLIARRLAFFLSYIGVDRHFRRSLKPSVTVDATEFAGYVSKAVERIENKARESRHAG